MSKIGKLPIALPQNVTATVQGHQVQVTGPKGNAMYELPSGISVNVEVGRMVVEAKNKEDKTVRALYGLTRANLANLVKGVDAGFEKKLELSGVGYRAQIQGADLVLSLGYSHPVKFKPLAGVQLAVNENVISITGNDKAQVGQMAAIVRAVRPPEPYKGKGIKYQGERVRRKAGKAAKAAGK